MKAKLLLFAVFCGLTVTAFAQDGKDGSDEILRKSNLNGGSFPRPWTAFPLINAANNNRPDKTSPAASTGYYIVDSDDDAGDYWRPNLDKAYTNLETDLQKPTERVKWRRIISGPRQSRSEELLADGKPWFINKDALSDSTDNAIAGPIKIGFPFIFNGVKYDSFYVSTNGLVALSNARYVYDALGNRIIPPGSQDAYNFYREDNMSGTTYGGARPKIGDGSTSSIDPTPDNYGFQFIANGNTTTPTGGIRNPTNTPLNALPAQLQWSPIIAPLWNDMQASQDLNRLDNERGQVWYKRADNPDGTRRLIIYFKSFNLRNAQAFRFGSVNFPADDNRIRLSFQVTLDESDSSVYVYFEDLAGIVPQGNYIVTAAEFARMNSTIGVSGMARHYAFRSPNCLTNTSPTEYALAYPQSTQFLANATWNGSDVNARDQNGGSGGPSPSSGLAIRFKQWRNVLRVVPTSVSYRGRALDPNAVLTEYPRLISGDFVELLAGHPQLGAIRPQATFQNMTNDIQGPGNANPPRPAGVNYTRQDLNFRTRFRIRNQATDQTAYSESVPISRSCLRGNCAGTSAIVQDGTLNAAGTVFTPYSGTQLFPGTGPCPLNGIPPYGLVQVLFPAFQPNELIDFNIGRLRAFVIAEPLDTLFRPLGEQWPFDDTVKVDLFVMRRLSFLTTDGFNDDANQYHIIGGNPMPSVLKWVNIDAEIADGDQNTYNAVPPRGQVAAANRPTFRVNSPTIKMNRRTIFDAEPVMTSGRGGDQLRSFPIDVRNLPSRPTEGAVLSVSIQRTGVPDGPLDRGWADNTLLGPEPRVIYNGTATTMFAGSGNAVNPLDEFYLEYARPSANEIENIARQSPTDIEWNVHPRRGGASAISNNPVFTLYGAGGIMRGYFENDKDSALTPVQGLRSATADDGRDKEFYKFTFQLPKSLINAPNNGAKNFRFRLRVNCKFNGGGPNQPIDDKDDFYVDNVRLLFPRETPDLEMAVAEVNWPYTITPASQMQQVPIRLKVVNNTSLQTGSAKVRVEIMPESDTSMKIYCRDQTVPLIKEGQEVSINMPAWNASRTAPQGRYMIRGIVRLQGGIGDFQTNNDTTYSIYDLRYGTVFAYDPANSQNDVPDFSNAVGQTYPNRGLALRGNATWLFPDIPTAGQGGAAFGELNGGSSGEIAMKFNMLSQDSLKGFTAYFASLNASPDIIEFNVYTDANGSPGTAISAGRLVGIGRGLPRGATATRFDEYVNYTLERPLVLQPGTYWISVAQLSIDNFNLGASKSRVGQIVTNYWDTPPGTFGQGRGHLNLDRAFRNDREKISPFLRTLGNDGIGLNNNVFSYKNSINGSWGAFTPGSGNPAYGHLAYPNGSPIGGYGTFSRGFWIPMLRPFFGAKPTVSQLKFAVECIPIPVELTFFDGEARANRVDLFWQTASEERNAGFQVERRLKLHDGSVVPWENIAFIPGAGNSSTVRDYNFTDADVVAGATYQYRLMQYDIDGGEDCKQVADILEFPIAAGNELIVNASNVPNPVMDKTTIQFNLTQNANVKVTIQDVQGNIITTLMNNQELSAGPHSFIWTAGNEIASGTYIYRIEANGTIITGNMSVVR